MPHKDQPPPLTFDEVYKNLSGTAALLAAEWTPTCKIKGEKDTEFVKRIVAAYLCEADKIGVHNR